jgi:ABC-type spermidine/putrescine transport system permease subunit I
MVSNLVVSLFGVAYNWPLGAAVSVVMLVLTFTLLWLANKIETAMNYAGAPARRQETAVGAVGAGGLRK